jgi:hypothetical protein
MVYVHANKIFAFDSHVSRDKIRYFMFVLMKDNSICPPVIIMLILL